MTVTQIRKPTSTYLKQWLRMALIFGVISALICTFMMAIGGIAFGVFTIGIFSIPLIMEYRRGIMVIDENKNVYYPTWAYTKSAGPLEKGAVFIRIHLDSPRRVGKPYLTYLYSWAVSKAQIRDVFFETRDGEGYAVVGLQNIVEEITNPELLTEYPNLILPEATAERQKALTEFRIPVDRATAEIIKRQILL